MCICRVPSSAALRVARGAGEERPEPGGENNCRLAVGSAAMLSMAISRVSVQRATCTGHIAAIRNAIACCLLSRASTTRSTIGECETKAPTFVIACRWMRQERLNSNISSHFQTLTHDLTGLLKGFMAPHARHADLSLGMLLPRRLQMQLIIARPHKATIPHIMAAAMTLYMTPLLQKNPYLLTMMRPVQRLHPS